MKNKGLRTVVLCLLLFFLTFLEEKSVFASENFEMPLKIPYVITSDYGYRIHPVTKKKSFHYGIDMAVKKGTPVYATVSGHAELTRKDSIYGNMVTIISDEFENKYKTMYAHLDSFAVDPMEYCEAGKTIIGYVGSTGLSTGPHLHFEVRTHDGFGVYNIHLNPRDVLNGIESTDNIDEVSEATGEQTEGKEGDKQLVYGLKLYAMSHQTGQVDLHIEGGYPEFAVYKSFDRKDWTLMQTVNNNLYTEYGLSNGQTVYYKVIDHYGKYGVVSYTPILINKILYPLKVVQIEDSKAHVNWDMIDFGKINLYLNGNKILSDYSGSGYTLKNLEPNNEYKLYATNQYNFRSNTVTFTTTDRMGKLEKLLNKLLKPNLTDSNSNGIPDIAEPINSAVQEAIDKLTGGVHEEVKKTVEELSKDSNFNEKVGEEFKIATEWQGMELTIMDLSKEDFKDFIDPIRGILVAILTVMFIILIISLFDIQFKV